LWSASFGLLLFKHLEMKPDTTVVDVGCGAGFPLLELAERLGNSCTVYGVDPWKNATERAKQKVRDYGVKNVQILECSAENIPLENASADLVVSNLGINNFDHPGTVLQECRRILKSHGKIAITTNLHGHWKEFYDIFRDTLLAMGRDAEAAALQKEENHRNTLEQLSQLFEENGFQVHRIEEDVFEMKFVDGTAFLNHHFVKLGWLAAWTGLFSASDLPEIFTALETNLNRVAGDKGNLILSVPMAYVEAIKTTTA
jgi:arsenite methyltransferase